MRTLASGIFHGIRLNALDCKVAILNTAHITFYNTVEVVYIS